MLTGEAPTTNPQYTKEARRNRNDFHCHIYEELTILKPPTIQFENNKLLTEPPKPFLSFSVVELCNLLLCLYIVSLQHFKYIFKYVFKILFQNFKPNFKQSNYRL